MSDTKQKDKNDVASCSGFYSVYNFNLRMVPIIVRLSEVDVQVASMTRSGSLRKESDDCMTMFKNNEQGQTNDDTWLYFATKVTGEANHLHPKQAPFIQEQSIIKIQIGA